MSGHIYETFCISKILKIILITEDFSFIEIFIEMLSYSSRGLPDLVQQANTVSPVNLNTKPEPAGEDQDQDDDDDDEEEGENEESKEEAPTYNEILTPAQLAQRQMIQDSLQMFQSSLAMRGQAEVGFEKFLLFTTNIWKIFERI